MNKKIVDRVLVALLILMFGFGSIGNLLQLPDAMKSLISLGYPDYFSYILGIAQLIAVIILVIPSQTRIKEWALIGMIINLIAALISHLVVEGYTSILLVISCAIGITVYTLKLTINREIKNQK